MGGNLQKRLERSPACKAKEDLLKSVPRIGKVTAMTFAIDLPELGQLDRKQISSLAGIAPFNCDSGKHRGTRRIRGGRAPVRTGPLYMACMRKRLTILNAVVRDDKPWNPALAGP